MVGNSKESLRYRKIRGYWCVRIGRWIVFNAQSTITVRSGRMECGEEISTENSNRRSAGRAEELCESRVGRHGLPSLTVLMVSVDLQLH